MSELQERILLEIGRGINLSKASLAKQLHKLHPDISDAVDILLDKEFIKQKGERQGRGKKEKFYILTDIGIEKLIEQKISVEELWQVMFYTLNSRINHELQIPPIDRLFDLYERDVLGYSLEYVPPLFDWGLENIVSLKEVDQYYYARKIIHVLGIYGSLTYKQVLDKLGEKQQEENDWRFGILNYMQSKMLVYQTSFRGHKRYHLTHFGLILLFSEMQTEFKRNNTKEGEIKKIIEEVISNHHDRLPLIFENWKIISKLIGSQSFLETFEMLLNPLSGVLGYPIQNGGLYEIINASRLMSKVIQNKIEMEGHAAYRVWKEFALNNPHIIDIEQSAKWNSLSLEKKNRMLEAVGPLSSLDTLAIVLPTKFGSPSPFFPVLKKIGQLKLKSTGFIETKNEKEIINNLYLINRDKNFTEALGNTITFLFFCILIHRVRLGIISLHAIAYENKISRNKIDTETKSYLQWWDTFLTRNAKFESWYAKWMDEIFRFTQQNEELIKQLTSASIHNLYDKGREETELAERLFHFREFV